MHPSCPYEVEWHRVSFQPFMKIMKSIDFQYSDSIIIPEHLQSDYLQTRQQTFKIYLADWISYDNFDEELNTMINKSGIPVDSIDYTKKIIFGSSVFRIKGQKGYWTLKAPCIYCYGEIAKNCGDDTSILSRCCIRGYL